MSELSIELSWDLGDGEMAAGKFSNAHEIIFTPSHKIITDAAPDWQQLQRAQHQPNVGLADAGLVEPPARPRNANRKLGEMEYHSPEVVRCCDEPRYRQA